MFLNFLRKRPMKARDWRMLCYLLILLGILGWLKRGVLWRPDRTLETAHYRIESSATDEQTRRVGAVAEMLYSTYQEFVGDMVPLEEKTGLQVRVYGTREEMRSYHSIGWAEAFYDAPCCYQFYDTSSANPFHWFVHEGTHQLNREVAHLSLKKWLDEGLAVYVSTSRIEGDDIKLGHVDMNTYPVWWRDRIATSGSLEEDVENGSFIPLRTVVSGWGGPRMRTNFNLYYLHWWTLVHFLVEYEDGRYRPALAKLLAEGGSLPAFERHVGSPEDVQDEWYAYVLELKEDLRNARTPRVEVEPIGR